MKTILLKMEVNWDNYDDVADELIIEDSGVLDSLKTGVTITQVEKMYSLGEVIEILKLHETNNIECQYTLDKFVKETLGVTI